MPSPRISGLSPRGIREFCEDESEHDAFCTIQLYSPPLHHRGYVDCSLGATCTMSGGGACTAQPVSLAHSHNSIWLCNSVCQATSQDQLHSQDFGGSPRRTCLVQGNCCPPGKGCNRASPSSRDAAGVLQPLLHRTQERRWPSANPGSASLESGPSQIPFKMLKVMGGALASLWEVGIRILNCLQHGPLVRTVVRSQLCDHRDLVLRHLSQLGLQVNWEKSKLSLVQRISFSSMELDSVSMMASLTNECAQSVLT